MKLLKTAEGKTKLNLTRLEWEQIGNQQGWIKEVNKTAQTKNERRPDHSRRSRMIEPDTGQLIEGIDMSIFDQTKLDKAKEWLEKNYPNVKWTLEKVKDWINKNFIGKAKPVSESNPIKDLYHGDHVRR